MHDVPCSDLLAAQASFQTLSRHPQPSPAALPTVVTLPFRTRLAQQLSVSCTCLRMNHSATQSRHLRAPRLDTSVIMDKNTQRVSVIPLHCQQGVAIAHSYNKRRTRISIPSAPSDQYLRSGSNSKKYFCSRKHILYQ